MAVNRAILTSSSRFAPVVGVQRKDSIKKLRHKPKAGVAIAKKRSR